MFDTLLDETTILGIAQGAAHVGLLPMPEIQYLAYIHNALDQMRGEAASLQFFSSGQFRTRWSCASPGSPTRRASAATSTTTTRSARCATSPALVLAVPARGDDAARMLRGAVAMAAEDGRVVVFLEPIALYHERDLHADGDGGWLTDYPIAPGGPAPRRGGRVRADGDGAPDLLIVSYANGLRMSRPGPGRSWLATTASAPGSSTCAGSIPLPLEAVREHAAACGRVLVVDECRATGAGVADALIADLAEHAFGGRLESVRAVDSLRPAGHGHVRGPGGPRPDRLRRGGHGARPGRAQAGGGRPAAAAAPTKDPA